MPEECVFSLQRLSPWLSMSFSAKTLQYTHLFATSRVVSKLAEIFKSNASVESFEPNQQ
jgi:hypothetical protein